MPTITGLRFVIRSWLHRRALDEETREELAFHVERQTQKHIAAGVHPAEAARRARVDMGGVERWREVTAGVRAGRLAHDLLADVRYAWRGLIARPGFTASAVATLAIGVGASTAIFGVVDGAMLRPLPFAAPDRIMSLALRMPIRASAQTVDMVWSYPKFALFRDRQTAFSALALHDPETVVVSGPDGAERVSAEMAGAAYFDVLGVHPARGRSYTPAEDRVGGDNAVVVIGDGFWRTRFGGRPDAIGQRVTVNGTPCTVVGIMPAGFTGLSGDAELWMPVPLARPADALRAPDMHNMELVGRLRPGVTAARAQAAVSALGARIDAAFPSGSDHWGAAAYRLSELRTNPRLHQALWLLGVAAGLVFLIVAVNLTTLLLTRGTARRQEFAVRLALGGRRLRLVRQLVTESLVLAGLGTGVGAVIAVAATRVLATRLPMSMPTVGVGTDLTRLAFGGVHMDGRSLAFAVAVGMLLGVGVGIASALRVANGSLIGALRQGSASASAPRTVRGRSVARDGLAIAQVALAVAFLVVSGLTVESLVHTLRIPLGFDPDRLLQVKVTLDPARARDDSTDALWAEIAAELHRLPGVERVAFGSCSPIGMHCDGTDVTPSGHATSGHVQYVTASPGYFAALGTTVLRGRGFRPTDAQGGRPVMVINRAAARIVWGSDDPLSTPVRAGSGPIQVVGVVDDARYEDVELPARPAVFMPFHDHRGVVFVRTAGAAAALTAAVRDAIHRAGAGHALGQVQTMEARFRDATVRERLVAQVFGALALVSLLLAAIGIYGTLSLSVSQRTREFSIRRALGASSGSLARLVSGQTATIVALGGGIGLLAALGASRGVAALLYEVGSPPPEVYAASAVLLTCAVAGASARPLWRALRVDPREAMRAD